MAYDFNKHAQKGNEFVNEVAKELGVPSDRNRAYRTLKAVLHTLRDKIAPEESLQLIAQLPLLIKGVYVDGWRISGEHRKMRHLEEFLTAIRSSKDAVEPHDFRNNKDAEEGAKAVFRVLKKHVSEGEINDIRSTLPKELKVLFA